MAVHVPRPNTNSDANWEHMLRIYAGTLQRFLSAYPHVQIAVKGKLTLEAVT
jgi:hypothetical protein